ncbi:GNAT family N-acetyltransferase [Priestia taiwanensis]|uniref:N-acetyltransferase n=1 Tax=Priestia taiwanensis TaxID=1347902 RepID=A0A917ALU2_9BACI|nr:GNAT family N-acetyltransferase [Priestia taiwanensis]MBM7362221.1 ribosomal protein S18 acetylase RimI-like enzyme [Priestia taiwanensis]GGE60436.1 N-acetyltransferase [Priestia taiwanensis]
MANFIVKKATKVHIEKVINLRISLLKEVRAITCLEDEEMLITATREYIEDAFHNDTFISYIAIAGEEIVGASGIVLFKRPPYPGNLKGLEAYILNIYTSPLYRQQGIANELLQQCMSECKQRDVKRIWLHATEEGSPIYAKVGFKKKGNEMEYFFS